MKTIRVHVAKKDLLGDWNHPSMCPIANRLKRMFPGSNIRVYSDEVFINNVHHEILNGRGTEGFVKSKQDAGQRFSLTLKTVRAS